MHPEHLPVQETNESEVYCAYMTSRGRHIFTYRKNTKSREQKSHIVHELHSWAAFLSLTKRTLQSNFPKLLPTDSILYWKTES